MITIEERKQLKQALAEKGITVTSFCKMLNGNLEMSYQTTARYCRCTERKELDFLSEYRWMLIDHLLNRLNIKW